jgi:addiction module HigA family antidote
MKNRKLVPTHPGEILLHDFMEPLDISQSELAKAIGVTPIRVSQLVRCRRSISIDTELRLSRYFGTRPGWWLDLQTYFDLEYAADELAAGIANTVKPCARRPTPARVPA